MTQDLDPALAAFVRQRRVRYAVAQEQVLGGDGPIPVGWDLRLFASHADAPHRLETCPVCAELEAGLRRVAEALVAGGAGPAEVEIDPEYGTLYQSPHAPGTDEVALDLRLFKRGDDARPASPAIAAYLSDLKARLRAAGAQER